MLILTRRIGEAIKIDDDITITILGVQGNNSARMGIVAPKDVPVHRKEIYLRIKDKDAELECTDDDQYNC